MSVKSTKHPPPPPPPIFFITKKHSESSAKHPKIISAIFTQNLDTKDRGKGGRSRRDDGKIYQTGWGMGGGGYYGKMFHFNYRRKPVSMYEYG